MAQSIMGAGDVTSDAAAGTRRADVDRRPIARILPAVVDVSNYQLTCSPSPTSSSSRYSSSYCRTLQVEPRGKLPTSPHRQVSFMFCCRSLTTNSSIHSLIGYTVWCLFSYLKRYLDCCLCFVRLSNSLKTTSVLIYLIILLLAYLLIFYHVNTYRYSNAAFH